VTEGWQRGSLIEFADLVSTGPFGSMLHKSDYVSDGVPLINPTNIHDDSIVPDAEKQVGAEARYRLSRYVLKAGDVVVGRRGEIGRCAVVGVAEAGWVCGTGCFFIRPRPTTDSDFLAWLLRSPVYRGRLERASTGTTMKNMSNTALAELHVELPTFDEQRRIVATLDEAFAGIATAKVNSEKNLQNARDLFANFMQSLLSGHGAGWAERRLEDVCDISSRLVDPREPAYIDLPHIGAGNIKSKSGEVVDVMTAREEQLISGKFLFDKNAVLYSKIRPYLMKVVRPNFGGLCSADIYPLVPKAGSVDRDYLYYLLLTPAFTGYAIKGSARAGMPKVNRDHLFAYRFLIPSIQEQVHAAAKLDALAVETRRLAEVCERKLAALDELKKSLLHQAFTGQLTSTKPTRVAAHSALKSSTPEFSANVIAIAFARHERERREQTFGHVKAQKVLHLAESIAKIDLGRQPIKDAAGPNDFQHMLAAEKWAKANKFFDMARRGEGYEFRKLSEYDKHLSNARKALKSLLPQLEPVIDLVVPMDTKAAEVLSTVHAAWNNLLIDGAEATDDAIVRAAREGWHADKLEIPESMLRTAIDLIRRKGLAPDGSGKYVGGQQRLL
jgi:type I restriction enzyme S subunit